MTETTAAASEPAHLFAPLQIREVHFWNRIGVSPMCEYSSIDGYANDWHFVHLGSRAVGGVAVVITEASAVLAEGRISRGIWRSGQTIISRCSGAFFVLSKSAAPFRACSWRMRDGKASVAAPWNGGRALDESEHGWRPIFAPSAIPFSPKSPAPEPLDGAGIARVVQAFGEAAKRAREAGAKIVEIHAAHGYLLHEFLSPFSNTRDDCYGGSFENRTRILREAVQSVRATWPASLPFVRPYFGEGLGGRRMDDRRFGWLGEITATVEC
jgi:2,4-dienoyl-CoA reductase-like NADH-dependent reductase (Old Yellow Enzyme family)